MTVSVRLHRIVVAAVFAALVLLGVLGRALPHPPNFTPVAAAALFAGFFFRRGWTALAVPLLVMAVSDALYFGFYDARLMLVVYAALAAPVAASLFLKNSPSPLRIGGAALLMSVAFFLSTNFAVWMYSGMYAPTFAGLVACYAAALPFFKYTLAGDLFWTTAIFGSWFLVTRSVLPMRQAARPATVRA